MVGLAPFSMPLWALVSSLEAFYLFYGISIREKI